MNSHYISLYIGYIIVVLMWHVLYHFSPILWNYNRAVRLRKPILEFSISIVVVITILLIGQLYIKGLLIPNDGNKLVDALNHILIFSPVFIALYLRKQSIKTIWLPTNKILLRLSIGLVLALAAIFMYSLVKKDSNGFSHIVTNTYHYKNISKLVQVFLEDITVAFLFVRLSSWIRVRWSIIIVALFFAAAHIPSLLANGTTLEEISLLVFDFGLGLILIGTINKSKDMWWFFMVHYAMDMTQFYA